PVSPFPRRNPHRPGRAPAPGLRRRRPLSWWRRPRGKGNLMFRRLAKLLLAMAILALFATFVPLAPADVQLKMKAERIFRDTPSDIGAVPFVGQGTASQLGSWTCYGEILLDDGDARGSLVGAGVIVFRAANGDLLVAVLEIEVAPDGSNVFGLHWRDSVTLS